MPLKKPHNTQNSVSRGVTRSKKQVRSETAAFQRETREPLHIYGKILSLSLSLVSGPLPLTVLWRAACISITGTLCPPAEVSVPDSTLHSIRSTAVLQRAERRRETIRRSNAHRKRTRLHGAIGSFLPACQSGSRPCTDHRAAGRERAIARSDGSGIRGIGTRHIPIEFASRVRRPRED